MIQPEQDIDYKAYIRAVDNFPKPGIRFYDIAPLLGNGAVFSSVIKEMAEPLRGEISKIVSFDARGFLFGSAMAAELEIGNVMLRKPGKLPGETYSITYDLEYGSNTIEIQSDVIESGEKVALVDDVIATGGTALAGIDLVRKCGGTIIEFCALVDLPQLGGSAKIIDQNIPVRAVIEYNGDS